MLTRAITRSFLSPLAPSIIRFRPARNMHIQSIPMSVGESNNYAYIVKDESTKDAVIIDPAFPDDAEPVLQKAIQSGEIKLNSIVNTHHHWDHSGGNDKIMANLQEKVPIIGGRKCQSVTETPPDRAQFKIGKNIEVTALYTPCHTQDSICWYMEDKSKNERAVFTGDTLFAGGCGRFFEGTAEEMNTALNKTLASLPDDTRVYAGHEYTKSNLKFLMKIASDNQDVQKFNKFAEENQRTEGKTTIGDEKKYNMFMRVDTEAMRKVTGKSDPIDVMAALREMKNKG